MDPRKATKSRKTNETEIRVNLNLDGTGEYQIGTGIPFFDHMLAQLARHGHFDLEINAKGDLEIDGHHTVEDVGWVLGQAFSEAGGDRRGIVRFAHAYVPLDEALTRVVIDLSGRPYLVYKVEFKAARIGDLQTELIEEFLKAFAQEGRFNLHVENVYGRNQHHIAETIFKATARALHMASRVEHAQIPSTKGVL
ncbi:MAG: imidazoleglycerol-phosphate dehydratase HisB [Acidobacteria bacterium]|nr:MAG: imidazoleglycerol-phosphate dehydratase HisB [Acidobacteriota bacterium]PYS11852.1 MAG: imidazoleglycerol-phosphate dehydratase HisB [Acidobacteriota bacterium]